MMKSRTKDTDDVIEKGCGRTFDILRLRFYEKFTARLLFFRRFCVLMTLSSDRTKTIHPFFCSCRFASIFELQGRHSLLCFSQVLALLLLAELRTMSFRAATAASRLTTRLAPGALTTAALAFATERGTSRASNQAVTTATRHVMTTTTRWNGTITTTSTSTAVKQALNRSSSSSSASTATNGLTQARSMSSSSSSSKSSFSFVQWYEGHLQARPIPTKMVTGSILWSMGDAVAQIVPPAAAGTLDLKTFQYDYVRTGRAFLFGFALHAPTSHAHFNFLEWMTVRAGVTGFYIPVFKAFMEQFV